MIILNIPEMKLIDVSSLISYHGRFFSLKKRVGHIKVLHISDVACTELTFITSYYICSWLLTTFKLMVLIKSGILLKNHFTCKLS